MGPLFAALTGVAFKEGLCYGKGEAAALFFALPLLLLGHLSGWMPEGMQVSRGLGITPHHHMACVVSSCGGHNSSVM